LLHVKYRESKQKKKGGRRGTVADSDTVNIRKLILIPTVKLGVLEPLHLLSRHAR
jgi:hypothetical protein